MMRMMDLVAVLLIGLLVLSNGEDATSTMTSVVTVSGAVSRVTPSDEKGETVELESVESLNETKGKGYAKKVTVSCSLPTCYGLIFHYEIWSRYDQETDYWKRIEYNIWKQAYFQHNTLIEDLDTPWDRHYYGDFVANFELNGPSDIYWPDLYEPPMANTTYHYQGAKHKYYMPQILSLNGRDSSDDLQFHEYEMKYKAKRGSTYTLFDFRDGHKYADRWRFVLDKEWRACRLWSNVSLAKSDQPHLFQRSGPYY
eukprot:GHVN01003420.1.p1 GENE.GHVN01003420.1~~GHVN01003420.1.p1  ORF type:complete len:255 (+),score=21.50 GHVN01003420.1:91-855(+)